MSVCVKGMYLPPNCYFFPMTNGGFYLCKANNPHKLLEEDCEERRPNWCPLIEIPEPHGRLIDADVLHKLFEDQWHYLQVLDWNENPTAEAVQSGINWCINTMHDDAPTVIPTSEDEINEAQRDYQAAADYQQYCETYEQTYDPDTGAM